MKRFSIKEFSGRFIGTFYRFSAVFYFLIALSAVLAALLYIENNILINERTTFTVVFSLVTGAILSLSLKLWTEALDSGPHKMKIYLFSFAILVAFIVGEYISFPIGNSDRLAIAAFLCFLVLSVFLLPFLNSSNDKPFWNFTLKLILRGFFSLAVAGVLMGGLSLLLVSFEELFGADFSEKPYIIMAILCFVLIAPSLFMMLIPSEEDKYDETNRLTHFGSGIVKYLFVPLLLIYVLTLYAYLAKIIVIWQLPDGWVSWLVSVLMLGMITVVFLLYPYNFEDGRKFEKVVMKYLPPVTLPLLVLMTIGIARRISDYGITVPRLYLIAFNLWCYAICIALFVKKAKTIKWIPASFAIVFLLVSVGPQSFANITRVALRREVRNLTAKGDAVKLPMNGKSYQEYISGLDRADAEKLGDKLSYLSGYYGRESIAEFADSTVNFNDYTEIVDNSITDNGNLSLDSIDVPAGFGKSAYIDNQSFTVESGDYEKGEIPVSVRAGNGMTLVFVVRLSDLKDVHAAKLKQLVLRNDSGVFHLSNFFLDNDYESEDKYEITISGILFFN